VDVLGARIEGPRVEGPRIEPGQVTGGARSGPTGEGHSHLRRDVSGPEREILAEGSRPEPRQP
jgi:hypothetical protein